MDEQTWLTTEDAGAMLRFVAPRAGARQLRLFACACARLVFRHLRADGGVGAVVVAERFADAVASEKELRKAETAWFELTRARSSDLYAVLRDPTLAAARAALGATQHFAAMAAEEALNMSALASRPWQPEGPGEPVPLGLLQDIASQARPQADLLREVMGNPFRESALAPEWLAWNGSAVGRIAETIYAERGWPDLPVLADALEEAGCDDAEVLGHLRGPGPHARGCWALDLARGIRAAEPLA